MVNGMPVSDVLLANVKMLTLSELNFLLGKVRCHQARALSTGKALARGLQCAAVHILTCACFCLHAMSFVRLCGHLPMDCSYMAL